MSQSQFNPPCDMTALSYDVVPYTRENLIELFVKKTKSSIQIVSAKQHTAFLDEYLLTLETKTIIVENDYVDRDFLEDFSAYYVRCFENYHRKCTRLHFFNTTFDKIDFLIGKNPPVSIEKLREDNVYLGFIVLKPLPSTIIGRTCLKTYPHDDKRYFPTTRTYEANLFGIDLSVKSLAFQEQDNTVSACATSALWSAFQVTGKLFQHPIPSPVEITKIASTFPEEVNTKSLSGEGLTIAQMAYAIRSVSLEPFLVKITDVHFLKSVIYAYIEGHIPLLLVFRLYDISKAQHECLGTHAVTVTGYSMENASKQTANNFSLKAMRISKIYVHDDQIGPFARMVFDDVDVKIVNSKQQLESLGSLGTSWGETVRAVPNIILAPLYNKIRITFNTIYDTVNFFDSILKQNLICKSLKLDTWEWDIRLSTINELKTKIYKTTELDDEYRKEVLLEQMPRFVWVATAFNNDRKIFDLLFDATDIKQGTFFLRAIEYDHIVASKLKIFSGLIMETQKTLFKSAPVHKIFDWFSRQFSK